MTRQERDGLRRLVSDAQKQRYANDHTQKLCSGCGAPIEQTVWDCTVCRDRLKARHTREIAALEEQVAQRDRLLEEMFAAQERLREENRQLRAAAQSVFPYQTEQERIEARRRTWRESKRRAAARKATA